MQLRTYDNFSRTQKKNASIENQDLINKGDIYTQTAADKKYKRMKTLRDHVNFYVNLYRTVAVATLTLIAVILDHNVTMGIALTKEMFNKDVDVFSWFNVSVGWLVAIQILSGFLGSWIAYSSIATRIQRFGYILPIIGSHVTSMVMVVVYSMYTCGQGAYITNDFHLYCLNVVVNSTVDYRVV